MAVQNSVDFEHLGAATSGTMLFRSIGGALGVALFGAIFSNVLRSQLAEVLPAAIAVPMPSNLASVQSLPPEMRALYLEAVVAALRPVFTVAAGIAVLGFVLTCMLREIRLRGVVPAQDMGESFAMPRDATSLQELERIVTALMTRENRWRVYADVAARAELDLPAPDLWMLARLGERGVANEEALSAEFNIALSDLEAPLDALCDRRLVERQPDGRLRLTPAGRTSYERLLTARRRGLADLLSRWQPERHPEVLALLDRLVTTLVRDLPPPGAARTRTAGGP